MIGAQLSEAGSKMVPTTSRDVLYTQSGLHHEAWCAPKVVYTTRRGPHHQQWRTPKVVYTTRRGSHHQLWCTPKVVHTTRCGSHQRLHRPAIHPEVLANCSSANSLTIQKILRSRRKTLFVAGWNTLNLSRRH